MFQMSPNKALLQHRTHFYLQDSKFLERLSQPEHHLLPRATSLSLQQCPAHQEGFWDAALPWPGRHLHPWQPWCVVASPSSPAPSGNRSWREISSHTLGAHTDNHNSIPCSSSASLHTFSLLAEIFCLKDTLMVVYVKFITKKKKLLILWEFEKSPAALCLKGNSLFIQLLLHSKSPPHLQPLPHFPKIWSYFSLI